MFQLDENRKNKQAERHCADVLFLVVRRALCCPKLDACSATTCEIILASSGSFTRSLGGESDVHCLGVQEGGAKSGNEGQSIN